VGVVTGATETRREKRLRECLVAFEAWVPLVEELRDRVHGLEARLAALEDHVGFHGAKDFLGELRGGQL
jgi:hypothetical protein